MSTPRPLNCTWTTTDPVTVRIAIDRDLDYDSADQLLYEVTERLSTSPGLENLHRDYAALAFCDSYGLSTLLLVRRRLGDAGAVLHLENVPPGVTRPLRRTNTLAHFTGPAAVAQERSDPS